MIRQQPKDWQDFLHGSLGDMLHKPGLRFSEMKRSLLPTTAGVYLITKLEGDEELPYYVGRTGNIQQRLYDNHLMGLRLAAPLKKYLIDDQTCSDELSAKTFIEDNCGARFVEVEDLRRRWAIEAFLTAWLWPKYGCAKEH